MTTFSYKAADHSGRVVQGVLEANDRNGAVLRLHELGYIPMRIDLARTGQRWFDFTMPVSFSSFFRGVSSKDVVIFTQDLSTLIAAGLPIDRALAILIDVTEKEAFRKIIADILKRVQGGSYLSDALALYPKNFSTFYVNMVRAGEAGGVLDNVLERLAIFLESSQEVRDFIASAMVYPLFLVFMGGISIIVLMTFVIPKFSIIFADMGQAIPPTTRFLLDFSQFLRTSWIWLLLAMIILIVAIKRYVATPAGRMQKDRLMLRLPVIGAFVKKVEIARLARTLGTLTKSGVPILQALKLVKDIVGNREIARSIDRVHDRVKEGDRLSKPLAAVGHFPPLAIQMITVGEETGKLDAMLARVADNYEKAVKNAIKRFISLLEPAVILVMGLVVGFIVVSMLLAIFSMNELPL
ncbi:MAG: type II secretion system inner membrane protein GspF [Deltaproteobacteria bacterium]|nr:type II secretion system inner membrane protein GspF [Deltaproteobacteria bacterium]